MPTGGGESVGLPPDLPRRGSRCPLLLEHFLGLGWRGDYTQTCAQGRESPEQIGQIWVHSFLSAFCEAGFFTCFRTPGWCSNSCLTDEKTSSARSRIHKRAIWVGSG